MRVKEGQLYNVCRARKWIVYFFLPLSPLFSRGDADHRVSSQVTMESVRDCASLIGKDTSSNFGPFKNICTHILFEENTFVFFLLEIARNHK